MPSIVGVALGKLRTCGFYTFYALVLPLLMDTWGDGRIPLLSYLAFYVYPSIALSNLRS